MQKQGRIIFQTNEVRSLFDEIVEHLRRAQIEDATREAEILLCHTLKKDRAYVYAHAKDPLDRDVCDTLSLLVAERVSGKPLQYILGRAEFMGITLEVNPSVLIPRQDTELLAEAALQELAEQRRSRKALKEELEENKEGSDMLELLDLCTGSGALAVAIAKLAANVRVTASDLSAQALNVARRNAVMAELPRPICFFEGDLFAALPPASMFDLIVSNPPYIDSAVVETLDIHVRDYEPKIALDGGVDGMDFIRRILVQAPFHLKAGGALLMEIGYDQGSRALALATAEEGPYAKARILKDYAGNDRVLVAHLK